MRSKLGILRLLVLTALLLVAQQAALGHALQHFASAAGSPSQRDGAPTTDSSLCAFHSACAQVLGGVNAACFALCIPVDDFEPVVARDTARLASAPLAVRSRSPPVVL